MKMGPRINVNEMTSREFQYDVEAHVDVQQDYLKDKAVIDYFQKTIFWNKHLFSGKTVLNLHCGVGLLALFAAKAGAKRIYAVDESKACDYAEQIVNDNGMQNTIQVIQGRVEEITLPSSKVDIILCDWVGYSLFFQSRCTDVIYARKKWLKAKGLIIPDMGSLYLRGFEDEKTRKERIDWWHQVYGFDMNAIKRAALKEPLFRKMRTNQVLTSGCVIKTINLNEAEEHDLKVRSRFLIKTFDSGFLDGIFTFFVVKFSGSHVEMNLKTDPPSEPTRWMQTLFFFNNPLRTKNHEVYYGGIEMNPFGSIKKDMKQIQVRLEMYSGDQDTMNLEADTTWVLKSHDFIENDKNSSLNDTKSDNLPENQDKNDFKIEPLNSKQLSKPMKIEIKTPPLKSKSKESPKIILGDCEYTAKVSCRKKSHHNKKRN